MPENHTRRIVNKAWIFAHIHFTGASITIHRVPGLFEPLRGIIDQHRCEGRRSGRADREVFGHQAHSSYYVSMREITAKEAKNRFGQLLRSAQQGPVRVTRNGTPVGVMLSVEQFERLRGTAWGQLAAAMDATSREAAANGLTPAALESLLSDES